MNMDLDDLKDQLKAIEALCPSSSLVIYVPQDDHEPFFNNLCRTYLAASSRERWLIRNAVTDKKGVLNCLLGYAMQSAEQLCATKDVYWLRIGLAAAAIMEGGYDERDFLLALADLYVTAEEAGIDPQPELEALGGGIPTDLNTYAVVRSRRERSK